MRELTLAVVGLAYPNPDRSRSNRLYEALFCVPGERVTLVPEPRNPHDANAVAVWSMRGVQLGYLTAERAPWIGARLRDGEEVAAVFQGLGEGVAYVRARFGGGEPTLPAVDQSTRVEEQADDLFFADPDGPHWGA